MSKLKITHDGNLPEVEYTLEKAVESLRLQREKKEFSEPYFKRMKTQMDYIMDSLFQNMIEEIAEISSSKN